MVDPSTAPKPLDQTKGFDPSTAPIPLVLVIGTLGTGKSTLLNRLYGDAQESTFETSRKPRGCTKDYKVVDMPNYRIVDTPGTNDPRMNVDWCTFLHQCTLPDG